MVAADEVHFGLLDEVPDLRAGEVLEFVVVGCGQVRAHAAVVAGDDDAAAAGGVAGRGEVFGTHAGGGAGLAEGFGVFVGADGADEEGALGGEHVLEGGPLAWVSDFREGEEAEREV